MKRLTTRFTPVILLLLVYLVVACVPITPAPAALPQPTSVPEATAAVPTTSSTNASPEPVSLKVVTLPFISFAPYWIAQDDGHFAEQGLNVELIDMTTQSDTLPAMLGGQVDVTSGQVYAAMFNAAAKDSGVKIVADKGYIAPDACENIAVIGRKGLFDEGPLQPEQLQGAKLTMIPGSWNNYYFEKLLAASNLTNTTASNTAMNSPTALEALNAGQVDITVQNEPWVTRMSDAGHVRFTPGIAELMPNSQSAVMLFGPKLLGENEEAGKRFMLAYLKAVRAYNEGKTDRNVEILSKYTKLPAELLQKMCWPALHPDGTMNLESVMDFQTWAVEKGLVQTAATEEQLFDTTFIEYASQELGPAKE
jgi:NitT/TauT family transport system substrate-binding protein